MELRALLLLCVEVLLLPTCLGREVRVEWSRDFALQHGSNSPLEVVAGDKLIIDCIEGGSAFVLPVNSTIAAQCNTESGVMVQASLNQYLADCHQNCIALLHQGMEGSSGYNYVPGQTYFFGDVPFSTFVCQFSIAVLVKENCSNPANPACRESTSSLPQPSSTTTPSTTPTATSSLSTASAPPLLCTPHPSSDFPCKNHSLQPRPLTLIIVCALVMATIITSA